jgi:hypothetical protein
VADLADKAADVAAQWLAVAMLCSWPLACLAVWLGNRRKDVER